MAEKKGMNPTEYLFSEKEALKRLFLVYGNTTDDYRTGSNSWLSFDRMLESHLKFMGYQIVLFYGGDDLLYSFDPELRSNLLKYFPVNRRNISAETKTQNNDDTPGATLRRRGNSSDAATTADEIGNSKIVIKAERIPAYLNRIMWQRQIKSCIVFTNCWDMLTRHEGTNEIANNIRSWYGLPTENNNISILLFDIPWLSENLFNLFAGPWVFLRDRLFPEDKLADTVIRIGAPHEDEIFYQLMYSFPGERITKDLESAAMSYVMEKNGQLKALRKFLNEMKKDGFSQKEAITKLISEYGLESQEDALEKIHSTPGWEEIYEMLVSLIEEKKSHEFIESDDTLEALTNLRMVFKRNDNKHKVNMSIMLKGNPGTGKTTVTQWIGLALAQHGLLPTSRVIKVAKQDLEAGYVGQTAIQTQNKINEALGGVLFVDEAYQLFDDSNGADKGRTFGVDAIGVFVDQMTSKLGEMAFIFAGYPAKMDFFMTANPGFERRFGDNIVSIQDYAPEKLEGILLDAIGTNNDLGASATKKDLGEISKVSYVLNADIIYHESDGQRNDPPLKADEAKRVLMDIRSQKQPLGPLSQYIENWFADRDRETFGNAGAAISLSKSLRKNAYKRTGKKAGIIEICRSDFPEGTEYLFDCRKPSIEELDKQLEDIVGMETVKNSLRRIASYMQLVTQQNKLKAGSEKIKVEPGHYLFIGNPGTGKTMISEKLALTLSSMGLIDKYKPIRKTALSIINIINSYDGIDKLNKFIENCKGGVLVIDEAHQFVTTPNGSVAVRTLLDPMLDESTNMSFIFCCYPEYVNKLLNIEPGLGRRISEMILFEDYKPEEIEDILLRKAEKQGYHLSQEENLRAYLLMKIMDLKNLENGGTAEKILRNIKINIGNRVFKKQDDDYVPRQEDLFEIKIMDIDFAIESLNNSFEEYQKAVNQGREFGQQQTFREQ